MADDLVLPFAVETLDLRGRVVRLGSSINAILTGHDYPVIVSDLLGQAVALAALLGSALKFDGRFQVQSRTDGAVSMLVVDYEAPDRVRGYAHFDRALLASPMTPAAALGRGQLGLTIDQGSNLSRYQGIVALEGQGLEEAAQQYFRQSEQIPTRVRLATGRVSLAGSSHDADVAWRAGGLLAQFMPTSPERQRRVDLHPGDAPEGVSIFDQTDDDSWVETRALVETIEDHELIDPLLTSEALLYRLFHENGVRVFEAEPVNAHCRCSRDRILSMLKSLSAKDRNEMIADDGTTGVTCDFCSKRYIVALDEIETRSATEDEVTR